MKDGIDRERKVRTIDASSSQTTCTRLWSKRNMTEQQYIENLRTVLNHTVGELSENPHQIAALRAGRLRLIITRNGVRKERLIPQPDLVDPSATQYFLGA